MSEFIEHLIVIVMAVAGVAILFLRGNKPGPWPVLDGARLPILLAITAFFFVNTVAGAMAMTFKAEGLNLYVILGVLQVCAVMTIIFTTQRGFEPEDPLLAWRPSRFWRLLFLLIVYALIMPVTLYLYPEDANSQEITNFLKSIQGAAPLSFLFLHLVVIVPLFEELLFRGLLQGGLRRLFGPIESIGIASMAFAIVHESNFVIPVFCLSLLLGTVYERERGIWASVFIHSVHNLVTFCYVMSTD